MLSKNIDFKNSFAQVDLPSREKVFIKLPRDFKSDGGQGDVVLRLKKRLYVQAKDARLWYEFFRNGLLERGFVTSKVDPCLFMSKNVICVVYVDGCLFWERSKSEIDNLMNYFKEDGPVYNWEHSKGGSVSEFSGIYIKILDDGGFQFSQTGLIHKVLEATGTEHCNGFPTPINVDAPLGTDTNGSEAKRYWPNSYASIIRMMLYLASNIRPDISFAFYQCARFTHNTKASHKTYVKKICWYLKGTKDNGLVINPSKKLVVDCYADAGFAGLWGHENTQDPICARSGIGFVVTISNFPLFWVSKLLT